MTEWFSAPPPDQLSGSERFKGADASVSDFWSFAMSDLRMNNVRGYLAEFLVARAVGASSNRIEWDAYDVLSRTNVKIEVKSFAYLQVWDQRKLSAPVFTGLKGRTWTPQIGESIAPTYNADVYVFCVQTAQTHAEYDPLDVAQWQFFVTSQSKLSDLGYKSISLKTLLTIANGPLPYAGLADAIEAAAEPR